MPTTRVLQDCEFIGLIIFSFRIIFIFKLKIYRYEIRNDEQARERYRQYYY
jgi:hypothetical protein